MGAPDAGADYYRIKLITDTWSDAWSAQGVWYEGIDKPLWTSIADGTSIGVASGNNNDNKVKHNDRYYKCIVAHDKASDKSPTNTIYWEEIQISIIKHEYPAGRWAEFSAKQSHLSSFATEPNTPSGKAYWEEIDATKAYAKGSPGALDTCIPQFKAGEKRQVELLASEEKYYFLDTFIQGGYEIYAGIWIPGSLAWIKDGGSIDKTKGRAAAVYR